jgi:hypothetical protein
MVNGAYDLELLGVDVCKGDIAAVGVWVAIYAVNFYVIGMDNYLIVIDVRALDFDCCASGRCKCHVAGATALSGIGVDGLDWIIRRRLDFY